MRRYHSSVLRFACHFAYLDRMDERNGTERLTEREKECLRLWLEHKTAKEIALDLGISHHAVEKRLKMARTKLDVPTSLDAARLLVGQEGYDRSVAQSADLAIPASRGKHWLTRPIVIGAIAMSLIAASLIVFTQQGGVAVTPKPGELLFVTPQTFAALDKDHSGFLEGNESPQLARAGGNPVYKKDDAGNTVLTSDRLEVSTTALRDDFYAEADANGDGKVSPAEYHRWSKPTHANKSAFDLNEEFRPHDEAGNVLQPEGGSAREDFKLDQEFKPVDQAANGSFELQKEFVPGKVLKQGPANPG